MAGRQAGRASDLSEVLGGEEKGREEGCLLACDGVPAGRVYYKWL
jgi:hypothetical protein